MAERPGRRRPFRSPLALGAAVLAAFAGAVLTAPAAHAADPLPLDDRLIDQAGVLTDAEEARLGERLEELARADGLPELYVVFVDEFTSPSDGPGWVDRTAADAFLGQNQYLLAIATEQRGMAMSYGDDGPLSPSRVDEIQDEIASEHLVDDEWAAAIDLAIDEFEHRPTPWWVWLLGIVGLGVVIWLVVLASRAIGEARARRRELASLDGQKRRAARELLRADSAVRDSAQELEFVRAEFGDDAIAAFATALSDARAKLTAAFERQRLLEDSIEDTPAQTRQWTDEILRSCTEIHRALRERRSALAKLRDLARSGESALARLGAARTDADATLAEAERRLADLSAAYPAADVVLVADAPEQMRESLADADEGLAELRRAVQGGRGGEVVAAIRRVEDELAEVGELREDIEQRARELDARGASAPSGAASPGSSSPGAPSGAAPGAGDEMARAEALLQRAHNLLSALQRDQGPGASEPERRRLQRVRDAIAAAETARPRGAAEVRRLAEDAIGRAEYARSLQSGRSTSYVRRESRAVAAEHDSEVNGLKALGGGFSGALIGGVTGFRFGEGGGVVIGIILGAVFGALAGAFGKGSGGSSSGWSSSRRRSSHSFSSHRSSGGSRRSSSGGRSSSGRRF